MKLFSLHKLGGLRKRWLTNTLGVILALGLVCVLAITASFAAYYYSNMESDMKDVKKRLSNIEGAFDEEFQPLLVTHAIPRLSSVERKLEDEVIPQLNHTRNFAEATYKLAASAMDWLSSMQADIDELKNTVQQHSKLLA